MVNLNAHPVLEELHPPFLITGATGFIGRHLMEVFESAGIPVHVLVRNPAKLGIRPASTKIFKGDINNAKEIEAAMEGCNGVFHLASFVDIWAKDRMEFYRVNVDGTRVVCETAIKSGVKKMVFTSTAGTVGGSVAGILVDEETPRLTPFMNDYEASKAKAEALVREYAGKGLNVTMVLPSRVFGPGSREKSNGYSVAMESYANGKLRFIPGTGNESGNYAFVDDVVMGHILAMVRGKSGDRYLLGGENIRFREFFRIVARVTGKNYRMISIPYFLLFTFAQLAGLYSGLTGRRPPVTPEYTRRFKLDYNLSIRRAKEELGLEITPFETGVAKTLSWMLENP